MHQKTKLFLKSWLPPEIFRIVKGLSRIAWSGDYNSWAEAKKMSVGYDNEEILKRVKDSLLKVKNGEAIYERDSILFDKIQYSWPLLAALMWITTQSKGVLNVIDFGGSLGSTYFQNKKFFSSLPAGVHWNIVEQKHFVDTGKKYFEDDELKFYYTIEDCMTDSSPNTILLSSVIQYLENPSNILEKVKSLGFEFILFDRVSFSPLGKKDRLTVQTIHLDKHTISYPCWFFDKNSFFAFFEDKYCTIIEFISSDEANIRSTFEGRLLRKK